MSDGRNWKLDGKHINELQDMSIERLASMGKAAHDIDVRVRINGEYKWFEADWIKHLPPSAATA